MAFGLYANDNKGFLPRSTVPQTWTLAIRDYIPANGNVVNNRVYLCPKAPQPPDGYDSSAFRYSVTFLTETGTSSTTATGIGGNGPRQITSILNPSRAVPLFDGWVNPTTFRAFSSRTFTLVQADFSQPIYTDESRFSAVSFRHGGNVAYLDGHTARITRAERNSSCLDAQTWAGRRRGGGYHRWKPRARARARFFVTEG